jgi:soluble cytochrome b562
VARLVLVVLAAAALGAACGGGSKALTKPQYEQRMRAVIAPLNVQLARLSAAAAAAGSARQAGGRIADVQGALRRAADELDAISAPRDVSSDHAEFVAGMREFADELDAARTAAEQGQAEALREAQAQAGRSEGARRLRRALGAIEDAGYDVGAD